MLPRSLWQPAVPSSTATPKAVRSGILAMTASLVRSVTRLRLACAREVSAPRRRPRVLPRLDADACGHARRDEPPLRARPLAPRFGGRAPPVASRRPARACYVPARRAVPGMPAQDEATACICEPKIRRPDALQ